MARWQPSGPSQYVFLGFNPSHYFGECGHFVRDEPPFRAETAQRAIPTTVPAKAKCPRVARVAKQVKLKLETVIPFRLDCSRDFRRRQHDDQLAFVPPVGRTLYASHPEPVRGVFL